MTDLPWGSGQNTVQVIKPMCAVDVREPFAVVDDRKTRKEWLD